MKKSLTYIASSLSFLALAAPAFAQTNVNPCATSTSQFNSLCSLDATKIGSVISTAVTIILIVATIIALFFLIWGGVRWILSQGDKAKVQGARDTIIGAIIGLVISFLAYFILTIILGFFGLSLNNLTLPKFT